MTEFPPTPDAEPVFMCGGDGCGVIWRDTDVLKRVERRRVEWAQQRKEETGGYPGFDEQVEFVARVTEEEEEAVRRRATIQVETDG